MRKMKSTALLSTFVAIAGVTAVSHEAGAATTTLNATIGTYAKEVYQGTSLSLAVGLTPGISAPSNGATIVLTLQNGTFANSASVNLYSSSTKECTVVNSSASSVSLSCASGSYNAGTTYNISDGSAVNGGTDNAFVVIPSSTNPLVLSYSSNISGDNQASVTLTSVSQQLAVQAISNTTYAVNPSTLNLFSNNTSSASNDISFNNSAYNNNWSQTITSGTLNFVFNGIPSSVDLISVEDGYGNSDSTTSFNSRSATVAISLSSGATADSLKYNSATYTFTFSNSGNIQPGNITVGPIFGSDLNNVNSNSYTYQSSSSPFMTWILPSVQIYVPSAFVPDNNIITAGYIILSMPQSASIASLQILNNTSITCNTNGLLTSTSFPGQYYIDLSKLPSLCPGVPVSAWTSGVPLVINISSSNGILPSQVTAEGWSYISGFGLQHLSTDIISGNSAAFSY